MAATCGSSARPQSQRKDFSGCVSDLDRQRATGRQRAASLSLTHVGGNSAWFGGGIVAYSNAIKAAQLGVPAALIEAGAVSERVVRVESLRDGCNVRYGVVERWPL